VIRLEGKGRTSLSRGTTGDLFVSIRYASHPDFQICGYDLHHRIVLRPWQFALGDVVTVPTIEGELQTKVLAGSRPGQNLKIRNQGLSKGVEERGDLFVELQIEFPQRLSVEAKQAWEAVRRAEGDAL
jgi:curved DNA-binding protein